MTAEVTALPLGLFSVPGRETETDAGVRIRAPYVVCAYLVRTPELTLLFDTGIVGDDDAVDRHAPREIPVLRQLAAAGVSRDDVDVVVNCHLHADHAGGNHLFPRVPVLVQAAELSAASAADYTVPAATHEFPAAEVVVVCGTHELADGVTLVPTPGHSPGHQSLVVEGTPAGTVLLGGQCVDTASEFASAVLATRLADEPDHDLAGPPWVADVLDRGIDVARFAHDTAQWRAEASDFTGSTPCRAWPTP